MVYLERPRLTFFWLRRLIFWKQIDDLFSQADIDGDGVISRTEFLTAFKGSSSDKGLDMAGMEQVT